MADTYYSRPLSRLAFVFTAVGISLATSCGAGTAALSGGSSGTNTTSTVIVEPTTVAISTPTEVQGGRVKLAIFLGVDVTQTITVESIEFSPRGDEAGSFRPATISSGFPSEVGPGSDLPGEMVKAREGQFFVAAWNSDVDFDALIDDSSGTAELVFPATAKCVVRVTVRNADTGERKMATTGEFFVDQSTVQTLAGGGVGDGVQASQAAMLAPGDVFALGNDRLYIADTGNNRVRRLDIGEGQTSVNTIAGNGFTGIVKGFEPGNSTSMSKPRAVAADSLGNVYIAEVDSELGGLVRRYDAETGILTVLVDDTFFPFDMVDPSGLEILNDEVLVISDLAANRVWKLSLTDSPPQLPLTAFSLISTTLVNRPLDIVADPLVEGGLLVMESDGAVSPIDPNGTVLDPFTGDVPFEVPTIGGIAFFANLEGVKSIAAAGEFVYLAYQGFAGPGIIVISRAADEIVNYIRDPRMLNPAGVSIAENGVLYVVDEGGSGLSTGSEGHLVLAIDDAGSESLAKVRSFAADGSSKCPTQSLAALSTQQVGLQFFFD